ncbi:tRNA nucleotidyltransferase/poly(A) polymerase family domain containing protein, putative [Babesia bigemina]|uniref:tRNA nucleotidyltransferase/poly(A) polymerase family domain containing protein, putative n=1 Tax=Babesia bigemina TaxID=5866 RepID=A0A061DBN3_BABBI|nr:tRNA nucleotidyltransferase/poly(A) polymerase family domain containing protein, putative [Babesia bigemina]CDR98121.1 tRNA nucleotidyltransferase/poly(A) polymerase family domain containing protein, putative [Babesia bigemina]|eukprot:XP_012770307.1 tRNA nucleotidyltransferase/poly(A) polymerase family domain containing protein, putative [Babesia bigemina]
MSGTEGSVEGIKLTESVVIVADLYRGGTSNKDGQNITIEITKEEEALFNLLKGCAVSNGLNMGMYKCNSEIPHADFRVAGGWVRDKLLKVESKDIDIALEHLTGVEFCNYLNAFTEKHMGFHKTVGVVKRRPEQSKHLETATLSILGLNVDFVNLRSEDYADDSRIPIMRIGSPLEDAMRRDFTINSLFYNISKNAIEDYTGKGIDDLKSQIIRTCSPAFGTFMDDPLRVIRAARFSARLGYALDEEIWNASSHPSILNQLANKPRIAQELDDMLTRGDVAKAFETMNHWGVLPHLVREHQCDLPSDQQISVGCKTMALVRDCLRIIGWDNINRKFLYLSAFCFPLSNEPPVGKCSYIEHVIKCRLKLPNKLASGAKTIVDGSEEFAALVNGLPSNTEEVRERIGIAIRHIGPLWMEALLLCMANEASDGDLHELKDKYEDLVATINQLGLQNAYSLKAPITGEELINLIPGLTRGPYFKEALELQIRLLLRSPHISKQELLQRVTQIIKDEM